MVAVIYLRVSTEEQHQRGYSIPEQRAACLAKARALAESHGTEPEVFEFTDTVSGDWLERPALDQVREFIRQRPVDYFICLDPDRFSRKLVNQLLIAEEIERAGCRLEFVQHEYRPDPEGQAFFAVRGIFSQLEKAKILERTSRGKRGKIAAGGIPHAFLPYGYRWIHKAPRGTSPLDPDPETAPWVRRMYEWCTEGLTPQAIARRLTALGVPPPRSRRKEWHRSTVATILRNPVYRGEARLNRLDAAGIQALRQFPAEWRRKRGLKLTSRVRPREEWRAVKVPPLVDPGTWQQAQAALDRHRRVRGQGADRWLRGLARCGICGSAVYYGSRGKGGRQYMTCRNRFRHGPGRCGLPNKLAAWVEEAVWDELRRWLLAPGRLEEALLALHCTGPGTRERIQTELTEMRQRLAAKEAEIRRIGLLFARGYWDQEETERELQVLRQERDEIRGIIAGLEARYRNLTPDPPGTPLPSEATALRRQVADRLRQASPGEKREVAVSLLEYFLLHPTPHRERPRVTLVPRTRP